MSKIVCGYTLKRMYKQILNKTLIVNQLANEYIFFIQEKNTKKYHFSNFSKKKLFEIFFY